MSADPKSPKPMKDIPEKKVDSDAAEEVKGGRLFGEALHKPKLPI